MQEWYHGWWGKPKKITKKQINEMVDNMKKTNIINEKSKQFHRKEEVEAENILQKLYNI